MRVFQVTGLFKLTSMCVLFFESGVHSADGACWLAQPRRTRAV
jgi:hypothetical protein